MPAIVFFALLAVVTMVFWTSIVYAVNKLVRKISELIKNRRK